MRLLGIVLALSGALVLSGYGVFYAFRDFFGDETIPLPVRIALPAVIAGVMLLLLSLGWERYRKAKEEHLGEVEK